MSLAALLGRLAGALDGTLELHAGAKRNAWTALLAHRMRRREVEQVEAELLRAGWPLGEPVRPGRSPRAAVPGRRPGPRLTAPASRAR